MVRTSRRPVPECHLAIHHQMASLSAVARNIGVHHLSSQIIFHVHCSDGFVFHATMGVARPEFRSFVYQLVLKLMFADAVPAASLQGPKGAQPSPGPSCVQLTRKR